MKIIFKFHIVGQFYRIYIFDWCITLKMIFHPELGSYLLRVSSDPALFSSYFWWRDYYTVRTNEDTYNEVSTHPGSPPP